MKVLLGISGGIAAYKSAELVRLYQQLGFRVQVVLTRAAREFVQPLTFAALTGQKVICDLFPAEPEVAAQGAEDQAIEHIAVAQAADVLVIAPATAHTLARLAQGLADDFLTTAYLATTAPVVVAPAMNVNMWRHPATQANLDLLRARGVHVVEPGAGYLACGMTGEGRMADLKEIAEATQRALEATLEAALGAPGIGPGVGPGPGADLSGQQVLITAGPTREALDPVRYLTNRSSGRMGFALAAAAAARGAQVTLISGPVELTTPPGVARINVVTAEEMLAAAAAAFESATMAILAAAVADYRAAAISAEKIKKSGPATLELVPTPDILATLGARKRGQVLVGFAAETDAAQALAHARGKLQNKNADLVVLNDVSRSDIGFDAPDNEVTLVFPDHEVPLARAAKLVIAHRILDALCLLRSPLTPVKN